MISIDSYFIEKLDTIIKENNREDGVELVYKHFGQLILDKELVRANEIMKTVLQNNYPDWILLPFATLSLSVKTLYSRQEFIDHMLSKLTGTPEQNQSTINRLK